DRAPFKCLIDKIVPIESFAANGKEEFTGVHGAGVDGIAADHCVAREICAERDFWNIQVFCDPPQRQLHASPPAFGKVSTDEAVTTLALINSTVGVNS